MSNLKKNENWNLFIDKFSIKNLKQNFGHDNQGISCDVYFDKRKMFIYEDEGLSNGFYRPIVTETLSEEDISLLLNNHIENHNIRQVLFDNGYNFFKTAEAINNYVIFDEIVNELVNNKNKEKEKAKIDKLIKKAIVYGESHLNYSSVKWIKINSFSDLVAFPTGLKILQSEYDKVKIKVTKNKKLKIFNE